MASRTTRTGRHHQLKVQHFGVNIGAADTRDQSDDFRPTRQHVGGGYPQTKRQRRDRAVVQFARMMQTAVHGIQRILTGLRIRIDQATQ
jgi:hypothetical protein